MPSLTVLLPVITLASIVNPISAYNFVEDSLKNLQTHQALQTNLLKKYRGHEIRDEDNDSNVNSISIQDVAALLEQVLNTDADYVVKKRTQEKQKHIKYLDSLNEQNLDDVLVYYPDSKTPMRSEERKRNAVLNKLGLSDGKPIYNSVKGIHKIAEQSQVNKKQNSAKNLLDQLNELDMDKFVLYDPDSDRPIRTEKKQKDLLTDLLGSTKNDVNSDNLNDEALVYVIKLDEDAIKNSKFKDSLNDLVSIQFEKSSSSPNDHSDRRKEHRYKGFRVKDVQGRRRGDPHEKFVSEEIEENRSVKRQRGFRGVARTPIPYIRHRGDIYEKYV